MCGFAGEFVFAPGRADLELARRMAGPLACRGPDQEGSFLSADGRCAIGFRRLAVLDPPCALQPMTSADGTWTIAFNGEAYNYKSLRARLAERGASLRTTGDTEAVVELASRLGERAVEELEGMFALALYRGDPPGLVLARDRLGQKPLFYAPLPDRIVFASQIRSLLLHPQVGRTCSLESLTYYLTIGYTPSPLCIYPAVRKLPPGCRLTARADGQLNVEPWWSLSAPAEADSADDPQTDRQRLDQVRDQLDRAVGDELASDVPLGILLSGGLDSTILTALAVRRAGRAGGIRTFTAGFADSLYDERPAARRTAAVLGSDHTELTVEPLTAKTVDELVGLFDEPLADASAAASWLICRQARQYVTVALGGEGGDEVFAGYDRYRAMALSLEMGPARYAAVKLAAWLARPWAGRDLRGRADRLVRFAEGLGLVPAEQYLHYRRLFDAADLGRLLQPELASRLDLSAPGRWFCDLYEQPDVDDEVLRCQLCDLATYLGDDLLVKSDTTSMAASLELRAPMLDERVVELGLSLPRRLKLAGRKGKQALRLAFGDLLPAHVQAGPKRGFGLPLAAWLRGPLREILLESVLDPAMTRIFDPAALAGLINDHLSGRYDHAQRLWALLVLGRWMVGHRVFE
ncbi:MAG: Asparagine synthetase (glutamine-hydrolyzing) 1 [Planctomycetes bacterium ADurb.Bin126]|nr:MAG: Asparagine synthetase (glutamine-hydrolyzing) 1 [Planctomycetes bacterium ADurb.Bin126]HOD80047.1 asparagine synthase (glutamine-hydrolyzing) [Phycisphaerae bacterium]HQL73136.1 asparagine synthase (glutamine-hydrolyzing) [Phycisphaerae bacterium]